MLSVEELFRLTTNTVKTMSDDERDKLFTRINERAAQCTTSLYLASQDDLVYSPLPDIQ